MTGPPALPCLRCASALEADDLRCPVCCSAVPEITREPDMRIRIRALRCGCCGAAMMYHAGMQASHCAFCGGAQKLEEGLDPLEQTEHFLPFKVDRTGAIEAYRRWVSRQGLFRPFDLASTATLESLRATWWPGWVADAKAIVTWTADSNAGAQDSQWAPHAGELETEFNQLVIPATRGLSPSECARLLPTYALETAVRPPSEEDRDVMQERFDLPRSQARSRVVDTIHRLAEERIKAGHIPGSRFRNFHASVQLRGLVTRRFAFPAYVMAYRYRGRLYRSVISGQDPGQVIGESPRSLFKLVMIVAFALMGLACLFIALRWFKG